MYIMYVTCKCVWHAHTHTHTHTHTHKTQGKRIQEFEHTEESEHTESEYVKRWTALHCGLQYHKH
jgi:hypothetical protein